MAKQERIEIDGSVGAIITFGLIREYATYLRRPFVMISRCNEVLANNSRRELFPKECLWHGTFGGSKVHDKRFEENLQGWLRTRLPIFVLSEGLLRRYKSSRRSRLSI